MKPAESMELAPFPLPTSPLAPRVPTAHSGRPLLAPRARLPARRGRGSSGEARVIVRVELSMMPRDSSKDARGETRR